MHASSVGDATVAQVASALQQYAQSAGHAAALPLRTLCFAGGPDITTAAPLLHAIVAAAPRLRAFKLLDLSGASLDIVEQRRAKDAWLSALYLVSPGAQLCVGCKMLVAGPGFRVRTDKGKYSLLPCGQVQCVK